MASIQALCLATIIGIAIHRGLFMTGEWHMQAAAILLGHIATYNILIGIAVFGSGTAISEAFKQVSALCSCYLLGLYGSMLVYRHFLHRLCGFPGPILARTSNLWHAWKGRHSQNHLVLDDMHQKYGDFVRTGPSEITIFDAAGFEAISGVDTKCTKSVWYDFMQPNYSIISARGLKDGRERRRVWSHAFGARALKSYEPRLLENLDKVDRILDKAATADIPVDVTNLNYWFAFDTMGEFAFADSFGMLDSAEDHGLIKLLRRAFKLLGPFTPVLWLARIALTLAPGIWRMRDWHQTFTYCHKQMDKRIEMKPEKPDIASYLIKDAEKNGFTTRDRKFLNGDAVTVIVAGSDSTALTLTFLLYNLAKYPAEAEKIFAEVANVDVKDALALQDLPHLCAVIEESLRLFPALPTAVQRETPPEGIMVGDRHIPGYTTVVVPRYTIGRRELYFERADEFIPERWYSRPEMVKNPAAHSPFSLGKYSCIGSNLALLNIKFVISALVKKYHIGFVPGTNPDLVHTTMKDTFTIAPGPLSLTFRKRTTMPQRVPSHDPKTTIDVL